MIEKFEENARTAADLVDCGSLEVDVRQHTDLDDRRGNRHWSMIIVMTRRLARAT